MLLNSVILVLGEILESALLVSLLLVVSRVCRLGQLWALVGIIAGLGGAMMYATFLAPISQWFDYVGQEVVNAGLQIMVYSLLVMLAVGFYRFRDSPRQLFAMRSIMILMVALTIAREGSEIFIHGAGLTGSSSRMSSFILGGCLGAGIGISTGTLLYYSVLSFPVRWWLRITLPLLALFGANMVAQATGLLIQADWLPSLAPLWDSSDWLTENSVAGQLLFALIGYEATPSSLQVGTYLLSFFLLLPLLLGSQTHLTSSRLNHHE
ncbi:MAG: hypothetical protein M0Q95_20785 [Porticoccaceae bacterium]|nr:hypothetical protein [Porticoccaceae bacterium]